MNKNLFIFFNVCYFLFDFIIIPYIPNPLLFGWLPLQAAALMGLPLIAACTWGYHFNKIY